jgi:hypothetical protein
MTVWDDLDRILDTYDAAFETNVGTGYAWSGQLRVTLTNPDGEPSRSMTFFSAGQLSAEAVALTVIGDFEKWLVEADAEPLPPPDWAFRD